MQRAPRPFPHPSFFQFCCSQSNPFVSLNVSTTKIPWDYNLSGGGNSYGSGGGNYGGGNNYGGGGGNYGGGGGNYGGGRNGNRGSTAGNPYSNRSSGSNSAPVQRQQQEDACMPIAALNPYHNRWVIKARSERKFCGCLTLRVVAV